MDASWFEELEADFWKRAARIVWCTVATVNRQGRPRTVSQW